jgi:hypothetical protein
MKSLLLRAVEDVATRAVVVNGGCDRLGRSNGRPHETCSAAGETPALHGSHQFYQALADLRAAQLAMIDAQERCFLARASAPHASRELHRPDVAAIVSTVAIYYNVMPSDILGTTRIAHIVWARHVAMFFVRELTRLSLTGSGRAFNRDHGAVLHAVHHVKDRVDTDLQSRADIASLRAALNPESCVQKRKPQTP